MKRREFNTAMIGLSAGAMVGFTPAAVKAAPCPQHQVEIPREHPVDCFEARLKESGFPCVVANPKDEKAWCEDAPKPVNIMFGSECGGGSWYRYRNYPKIYTDERVPEGFIWEFEEWNEETVEVLKGAANFSMNNPNNQYPWNYYFFKAKDEDVYYPARIESQLVRIVQSDLRPPL